jgi:hypothetical protein
MIDKKVLEESYGIVEEIFIPEVYDDEEKAYLEDDENKYIGYRIKLNNKELKLIKEFKNEKIYAKDKVKIKKIGYLYTYEEYKNKLKELININNLSLTKKEKENVYNKCLISEEDFNKEPYYVIDYEIV